MAIRVVDGSDTTKEGFELIGLNADEMAAKFAAGGDSAKEAFKQTVSALAGLEDPLAQNTAGVDLLWYHVGRFGTGSSNSFSGYRKGGLRYRQSHGGYRKKQNMMT